MIPLETPDGIRSDHLGVYNSYKIKRFHQFKIKKYQIRKVTKKGKDGFIAEFKKVDWSPIYEISGADGRNEFFYGIIMTLMDKYFPIKSFKVKNTDLPWMTDWLRNKIKRRNKLYKETGKSDAWRVLKLEIIRDLETLKKAYFNKECQKLSEPGSHRISFSALKNLKCSGKQEEWVVFDMYQDMSEEDALEELATFF